MTLPEDVPDAARFFDAIAPRYDRVYGKDRDQTRTSLARVLGELAPASRVLDLGVGTGRELPALLDGGHAPVGFDASQKMLDLCAKRARPVPLFLGDLWARLPWDDRTFDAVLALHGTLSHPPSLAAREAFPREVARVLRPGGVFVAEVPTPTWLERAVAKEGSGVTPRGPGRGRFVDAATGAKVEVWVLPEVAWRKLFERDFTVGVSPEEDGELFLVARRA